VIRTIRQTPASRISRRAFARRCIHIGSSLDELARQLRMPEEDGQPHSGKSIIAERAHEIGICLEQFQGARSIADGARFGEGQLRAALHKEPGHLRVTVVAGQKDGADVLRLRREKRAIGIQQRRHLRRIASLDRIDQLVMHRWEPSSLPAEEPRR
jgi:hypothetical protein